MNSSNTCPFCTPGPSLIVAANGLVEAISDACPVSPGATRCQASKFARRGTEPGGIAA